MLRAPVFALALAAALAGCSSGPAYPSCQDHQTVLSGTLDGAPVTKTLTNEFAALSQGVGPGTLDVTFLGGGHLKLGWAGLVADGQETDVTGELALPGESTRTLSAGSTLHIVGDDGGYEVVLKIGSEELLGCVN